jgi:hypothetical protein
VDVSFELIIRFGKKHGGGNVDNRPGPGEYDPSNQESPERTKHGKGFTFGSPSKTVVGSPKRARVDGPAPGSYNPVNLNKSPAYKMGAKRDIKMNDFTPGPGAYTDRDNYNNKNSRASCNRSGFGSSS